MKISISKKLMIGFTTILLLLVIGNLLSINRINSTDAAYKKLITENVENAMSAKDLNSYFMQQSRAINNYLLTGNEENLKNYETYVQKSNEVLATMGESFKTESEKEKVGQLAAFQERYNEIATKLIAFKQEGNVVGYTNVLSTSGKTITNVFNAKIVQLDAHEEQIVFGGIEIVNEDINASKLFVVVMSALSVLVGLILSLLISRSISKPIIVASDAIQAVSKGDLSIEPIKVKNKDEVGDLVHAFNIMVDDLRDVVGKVQVSSSTVAASSEELAASAEQSTAASEQVAKITQVSAEGNNKQLHEFKQLLSSMSEMNADMNEISSNSKEMHEISNLANSLTKKGEEFIDHLVSQMNYIQSSVSKASNSIHSLKDRSNEISEITKIITDVAEQTNLLALNAAIEAARAGEHGKGFAVVAGEVKNLAEESKRSASQITEMILHIQNETQESVKMMEEENKQVIRGLKDTEEANKAFKEISQAMGQVSSKVMDVSTSIEQMLVRSNEILHAIEVSKVITEENVGNSQENAAATEQQHAALEEIAASAQFLSQLADDLQSIISKFNTAK